jgi:hypothetical protein
MKVAEMEAKLHRKHPRLPRLFSCRECGAVREYRFRSGICQKCKEDDEIRESLGRWE